MHLKQLKAYLCYDIMVGIDYLLLTTKGHRMSFWSMVLSIELHRDDNTAGLSLFQGIDFCQDMSQMWINKIKGDKISAHIFTYNFSRKGQKSNTPLIWQHSR